MDIDANLPINAAPGDTSKQTIHSTPSTQNAVLLADVKAEPSVAAARPALHIVCARRPRSYAVGAGEKPAARSNKRNGPKYRRLCLRRAWRLWNGKKRA